MSAIDGYIETETKGKDGVLTLKDDKTGEDIAIKFVDIHQPVRRLKDDGQYFVCTDFRKAGTNDQFYDIDFWVGRKNDRYKGQGAQSACAQGWDLRSDTALQVRQ